MQEPKSSRMGLTLYALSPSEVSKIIVRHQYKIKMILQYTAKLIKLKRCFS